MWKRKTIRRLPIWMLLERLFCASPGASGALLTEARFPDAQGQRAGLAVGFAFPWKSGIAQPVRSILRMRLVKLVAPAPKP